MSVGSILAARTIQTYSRPSKTTARNLAPSRRVPLVLSKLPQSFDARPKAGRVSISANVTAPLSAEAELLGVGIGPFEPPKVPSFPLGLLPSSEGVPLVLLPQDRRESACSAIQNVKRGIREHRSSSEPPPRAILSAGLMHARRSPASRLCASRLASRFSSAGGSGNRRQWGAWPARPAFLG